MAAKNQPRMACWHAPLNKTRLAPCQNSSRDRELQVEEQSLPEPMVDNTHGFWSTCHRAVWAPFLHMQFPNSTEVLESPCRDTELAQPDLLALGLISLSQAPCSGMELAGLKVHTNRLGQVRFVPSYAAPGTSQSCALPGGFCLTRP